MKKNKKLKIYFISTWLPFYIKNVVSFDFLYKFQFMNIPQLQLLCKKNKVDLSFDISDNTNMLHELSDSIYILQNLTLMQKPLISQYNNLKKLYKCVTSLNNKYAYFYFLNIFICYLYPIIKKRQSALYIERFLNSKVKTFIFTEFHLFLNSKFDFLENKSIMLNFDFNLKSQKGISLYLYFLSSLNLHND